MKTRTLIRLILAGASIGLAARCGAAPRTNLELSIEANPRFRQFGIYLSALSHRVLQGWQGLGRAATAGCRGEAAVTFRIDAKGEVAEILKSEGSAGEPGIGRAVALLKGRAPFGRWSREMVDVLGESQVITLRFHYGGAGT